MKDENVARVSPLSDAHVNVLGRYYAFELDGAAAGGGLPPLRDPDEMADEYEFPAVPPGEPMP